jgi:hypothetical protein
MVRKMYHFKMYHFKMYPSWTSENEISLHPFGKKLHTWCCRENCYTWKCQVVEYLKEKIQTEWGLRYCSDIAEGSVLVGCIAVSLAGWIIAPPPSQSGNWRWSRYDHSNCQELYTQQHNIPSEKNWISVWRVVSRATWVWVWGCMNYK